ncbi:MAG: methyltransferase domain-containing protein [Pleurocapsa minor HA4230-MV1]|jgi:spermidine synthase|nr:methyltransferase domain-containing protein [Pleurocapsa minor HA4230-MV1]
MSGSELKADLWINEYITPWDIYTHGVTKILAHCQTQYQEMYIVETGAFGKGLVLDGKWQSCTVDEFIYHEALVHPPLIAHQNPKRVLVLGGGEGATIREVLRWNSIELVTMIDIDGEVVEACKQHLPEMHQDAFADPRVKLMIADALEVLDTTTETWDIIISDLSDPIESGPSFALFTKEYFTKLKRVLNPGGYVMVQAGPISPPEVKDHARLVNTLKAVFSNVTSLSAPTPSYGRAWGFAMCSESAIALQPQPESVDRLLQAKTTGGYRFIDGISLLGIMQTPLYIRQAIATETTVYTLNEPPKFFGTGVVSEQ